MIESVAIDYGFRQQASASLFSLPSPMRTMFLKRHLCLRVGFLLVMTAVLATITSADMLEFSIKGVKTGPFNNPQEFFPYSYLPFCRYQPVGNYSSSVSFVNSTDLSSIVSLRVDTNEDDGAPIRLECNSTLSSEDVSKFKKAITHRWFYQWSVGDLPAWGLIGAMTPPIEKDTPNDSKNEEYFDASGERYPFFLVPYLSTERTIMLDVDKKNRLLHVDLFSSDNNKEKVEAGKSITFRLDFQIQRREALPDQTYEHRFQRFLDLEFFGETKRRFSAINSLVMLVFSLLPLILFVKRDIRRPSDLPEQAGTASSSADDTTDEDTVDDTPLLESSGWNRFESEQLFASPKKYHVLAALLGIGWQITVVVFVLLAWLSVLGEKRFFLGPERIFRTSLYGFGVSAVVAGYVSTYYALELAPRSKSQEINFRAGSLAMALFLFPTIIGVPAAILNAWSLRIGCVYSCTWSIFFGSLGTYFLIAIPSSIVGSFLGTYQQQRKCSSHDSEIVRILPLLEAKVSLKHPRVVCFCKHFPVVGLTCFWIIFLESNMFFHSLWKYKFYLVSPITTIIFVLWMAMASASSAFVIRVRLGCDKPLLRYWQWEVYLEGLLFGASLFLQAIYFFFAETQMNGAFQVSIYFGVSSGIAIAAGLACGAIGHVAAYQFLRLLYTNKKTA